MASACPRVGVAAVAGALHAPCAAFRHGVVSPPRAGPSPLFQLPSNSPKRRRPRSGRRFAYSRVVIAVAPLCPAIWLLITINRGLTGRASDRHAGFASSTLLARVGLGRARISRWVRARELQGLFCRRRLRGALQWRGLTERLALARLLVGLKVGQPPVANVGDVDRLGELVVLLQPAPQPSEVY